MPALKQIGKLTEEELAALHKQIEGLNLPKAELTSTPGASRSTTVASGPIAELAQRNPNIAKQLADVGSELRAAGMENPVTVPGR